MSKIIQLMPVDDLFVIDSDYSAYPIKAMCLYDNSRVGYLVVDCLTGKTDDICTETETLKPPFIGILNKTIMENIAICSKLKPRKHDPLYINLWKQLHEKDVK